MTETMPAAVYHGTRSIAVENLPVPEPRSGEVMIEVSHCGICGSDLHFVIEGWGEPGSVHGHEYSGIVVSVGSGVDAIKVGDRVVGGPGHRCGQCKQCRSGRPNLCVDHDITGGPKPSRGAFARFKVLEADSVYSIPSSLDLRTAALSEPVAVALRGIRRSGLQPGDRALVTGGGPIGTLTVATLRALGIDDITLSEPHQLRRDLASAVGATTVCTPADFVSPAMPMEIVAHPFDAAIECSGRADAMVTGLQQLAKGGTLVLSGTGMARPKLDAIRIIVNELTVTGTAEYTPDDFRAAIDLLASGALPTATLIEDADVPLSGVLTAMEQLAAGELAGKVMVVPNA
jgi:(R,R)-butanediol dehydrogenase/meso-butanediol dehydrogenase/diacetyl reductase